MASLLLHKTTGSQVRARGLLKLLPGMLVPYAELMRLEKPAGCFAFYFPHLAGMVFAQTVQRSSEPQSLRDQVIAHVYLLIGCVLLRGASCAWNDTLDAPFDAETERCRTRPIARGAVSRLGGALFTIEQTLLGILLTLAPLPRASWTPAFLLASTQLVYPLFKRFTNYPQVWLGCSFAFGIGVGAGAGGIDLTGMFANVVSEAINGSKSYNVEECKTLGFALCLFVACVINVVIYDTIYGYQDLADDLKAGIGSLAVSWQDRTKFYSASFGAVEVALLAVAGVLEGYGFWYNTIAVGGTALILSKMLYGVDLNNVADCMRCFKSLIWGTGVVLALGLAAR